MWNLSKEMNVLMASFEGGNLRNAIAREAFAVIMVPFEKKEKTAVAFNIFRSEIENELAYTEPKIKFSLESTDQPEFMIDQNAKDLLLNSLYACPHGVLAMSYTNAGNGGNFRQSCFGHDFLLTTGLK